MRTIWKFPLSGNTYEIVKMPQGAEILSIQRQGPDPVIWAMVESEAEKESRGIWMFGTGWNLNEFEPETSVGRFIGTVQNASGSLVFHYFEAKR